MISGMTDPIDGLLRRIAAWEDLHTELKQWRPHPEALADAIVAFANTDGGDLIIGVAEDRTVGGVPDADEAVRLVEDAVRHRVKPPVTVVPEVVTIGAATVVVAHVPRGDERPYQTNQGVHYVRTAGGKRLASRQELLRLFQASRSLFFDEAPVGGAALADLHRHAVEAYLASLDPPSEWDASLLVNLNLARGTHPTVAAVLLFGTAPNRLVPGAYVSAARIAGLDLSGEVVDRASIEGPLPAVIDETGRFLRAHLRADHTVEGFEREGRPEIPETALREAVTNAVVHRDYTVAGPVRVLIFDDRVEVRSPGRLPNTVTVDAMRRGAAHVLRNPTVFSTLLRLGYVTDVGCGVSRIIRQVREHAELEVGLVEEASEFVVSMPRPWQLRSGGHDPA